MMIPMTVGQCPGIWKASEGLRMMLLLAWVMSVFWAGSGAVSITVGTYNLWNVMFNWDVRKHHIAEMIKASNLDVIGLQEVRAHEDPSSPGRHTHSQIKASNLDVIGLQEVRAHEDPSSPGRHTHSQVDELQQLLMPDYKWSSYLMGHAVEPPKEGALHQWQLEGVALLSRYPMLRSHGQDLSHHSRVDKVRRNVLHATVLVEGQHVTVSVVHLSYDKWQQCNNVAEIMKYIRDTRPKYSIILGDFNTYNDYEGPLEGLHLGYFSTQNKCPKYAKSKNPTMESELKAYKDAWKVANYGHDGFTFSNMPIPGFVSRPDRILVSDRYFAVRSAELKGHGPDYAKKSKHQISNARQTAILDAAKKTYHKQLGGNCVHDCGPYGSCRCGICVRGGNKNACAVPDCHECSADLYRRYLIIQFLTCAFSLQLLVAAIQIALTLYRGRTLHRQRSLFQVPATLSWKRLRHIYHASCLSCLNLCSSSLAIVNFLFGFAGVWSMRAWSHSVFQESSALVGNVLPEEYNPSDHLMVIAEVDLT